MRFLRFIIGGLLVAGGLVLFIFSLLEMPFIFRVFDSARPGAVLIAIGLATFIGGLYLMVHRQSSSLSFD